MYSYISGAFLPRTKYSEAFLYQTKKQSITRVFIEEIIRRHDKPEKVLTDQGKNFTSELFQEMCKLLGTKKLQTTAHHPVKWYHPERSHQTVMAGPSQFTDDV